MWDTRRRRVTGEGGGVLLNSPRPAADRGRRRKPKPLPDKDLRRQTYHQDHTTMHYPHKISKVKRARKIGFRARMATKKGRQAINRKRRVGRRVQVV